MEPNVITSATGQLLQFGILGIVCLVFAYVIYLLWRQNNKLHEQIVSLQETRVSDAKTTARSYAELSEKMTVATLNQTAATDDMTEMLKELRIALQTAPHR